ncbi:hypothetical protein ACTXT7_006901 [Hymenolepis weldensis]
MELLREPIIRSVCKLTLHAGFKSTSEAAIELLAEVLYRYLSSLSKNIADLSDGKAYNFVNGVAALGLQGESVKGLLEYVSEVGPYFPKPPAVFIPLQGKVQLNLLPTKCDPNNENVQSIASASLNDKVSTDSLAVKTDGVPRPLSTVVTRPNGRNLPSWASKSRYKLTCVSYNSTTHNLITHSPPPPIKPVTPPNKSAAKRRSSRPTASTFRRPLQVSSFSPNFIGLPTDKSREDAWERALAATISPPSKPLVKNAHPLVNSPSTLITATAANTEIKNAVTPSTSVVNKRPLASNRKPPPSRKKSIYARRKRPFSTVRLPLPSRSIKVCPVSPPSPLIESRSVSSHNRSPAASPSPERPSLFTGKMESLTVNTDIAEVAHQQSSSSTIDQQSRRSDRQITPVRRSRPSLSSGGGSVFHESPLPPRGTSTGSSSLKRTEMTPKTPLTIPSPSTSHRQSHPTVGDDDDDFASGSDTEPMRCEEESRTYEILTARNVPATATVPTDRRSIQSSSMSSTAPSSTSSTLSSSHSATSERSEVKPPMMRIELASRPAATQVPLVKPFSESSRTSSIPSSVAYRQSAGTQAKVPHITQPAPQPAPMMASGVGLKLKIRKVGETMSVQSSDRALTNTISSPSSSDGTDGSSSSSSSRDTSPLSSRQGSDAETAARRHAAIPPAFIAHKTAAAIKPESPPRVFFPSSTQQQKQAEPSPLPKAPKIRIKWDAHGKASTSLISTEESFTAPQRPNISHERLRGSSISNVGSSSSSTSRSQSSYDDDDEGPSYPLPPISLPIPPLYMLSDIPPRLPSSSSSTATAKPPPQLKPLHIELPLLPQIDPLPALPHSPAAKSARDKSKKKSSIVGTKQGHQTSPPALPKLDLITPITSVHSTSRKRTKVYSSDDSSSNEEEAKMPIPSTSYSKRGGQASKKRRFEEDKPVERQQLFASGGSSYYAVENGEKLWLCPICSLPGGDMVGCDGCDDWFHFQCVGLHKAPETEKWFCPSCTRSQASAAASVKKASSSTSRKHSQKHSSGRRR